METILNFGKEDNLKSFSKEESKQIIEVNRSRTADDGLPYRDSFD